MARIDKRASAEKAAVERNPENLEAVGESVQDWRKSKQNASSNTKGTSDGGVCITI
jgi:hypothetical protein